MLQGEKMKKAYLGIVSFVVLFLTLNPNGYAGDKIIIELRNKTKITTESVLFEGNQLIFYKKGNKIGVDITDVRAITAEVEDENVLQTGYGEGRGLGSYDSTYPGGNSGGQFWTVADVGTKVIKRTKRSVYVAWKATIMSEKKSRATVTINFYDSDGFKLHDTRKRTMLYTGPNHVSAQTTITPEYFRKVSRVNASVRR
jgi:hypothetical protein